LGGNLDPSPSSTPTIKKHNSMRTSFISPKAAGLGLLFSAFLVTNAIAGPGIQYWQSLGKPAPAAKQVKADISVCPGSELVPITVMKPAMANGKGPLTAVKIGTERVCHVCSSTSVFMTNDWPNHRGPLVQKVVETKAGATHVCTANCPPSSRA